MLVAGACLPLLTACAPQPDSSVAPRPVDQVARSVEELLSLSAGAPVRVLRVQHAGHSYRLTVQGSAASEQPRDVHVSLDGQYLFDAPQEIAARREQLLGDKRFVDCMLAHGARLFVDGASPGTRQQLAVLGPFASRLAIDCSPAGNPCAGQGIKELPTFAIGDKLHPGQHTRGWVEAATGCK